MIERITRRIQSWVNTSLSYVVRLVLINYILNSLYIYWSMHFILPRRLVESILRRFLWKGCSLDEGYSKVLWHTICRPTTEGGLGLRDLKLWNLVLLMKQVWFLRTYKVESLWIRWIKDNILKDRNLWEAKPPRNCSWAVRKILQCRNLARNLMQRRIGNGEGTFFWFDNWCNLSPLIEQLNHNMSTPAVPRYSSVRWIISDNRWQLMSTNQPLLEQLAHYLAQLPPPNSQKEDSILWIPSPDGTFNASKTWLYLHSRSPTVSWHLLAWFPGSTPKHAFILWLASWNRLPTLDKAFLYKN